MGLGTPHCSTAGAVAPPQNIIDLPGSVASMLATSVPFYYADSSAMHVLQCNDAMSILHTFSLLVLLFTTFTRISKAGPSSRTLSLAL